MLASLPPKLNLPPNVKSALIETRVDGKILPRETRNKKCGTGYYKVGIELEVQEEDKTIRIESWTVENGMHVLNFECLVTIEGKLIRGRVNCFALGMQLLDQDYLDELFSEMKNQEWDSVATA